MIQLHEIIKYWINEDKLLRSHFFLAQLNSANESTRYIRCRCTYVDVVNGKIHRPDDYRDVGKIVGTIEESEVRVYTCEIIPAGDPHFFEKLRHMLICGEMHFVPDSKGDLQTIVNYHDPIWSMYLHPSQEWNPIPDKPATNPPSNPQ